ncbi:MAG: hypothetical protein M1305_03335 [Candidatus Marsarchaeota archaeon]|nr:hypothetical protein [Candidatus Marsarchaeota archaeon]
MLTVPPMQRACEPLKTKDRSQQGKRRPALAIVLGSLIGIAGVLLLAREMWARNDYNLGGKSPSPEPERESMHLLDDAVEPAHGDLSTKNPVFAVSEGGMYYFLSERPDPFRDDEVLLSLVDDPVSSAEAIARIGQAGVCYVVVSNLVPWRLSSRYAIAFSQGHAQALYEYLTSHFTVEQEFANSEDDQYSIMVLKAKQDTSHER